MIMATVEDGLCWYLSFSVWDFTLGRILNNARAHYTLVFKVSFSSAVPCLRSLIIHNNTIPYLQGEKPFAFWKVPKAFTCLRACSRVWPKQSSPFYHQFKHERHGWFSFKGVTAVKPAQWVIRPGGPWNSPKSIFIIPGFNRMTVVA